MKHLKIDLFKIVFYTVMGILCYQGTVPTWAVALFVLHDIKFTVTYNFK